MKLLRPLKEKRYLILAFTLPAILLALAIVFLQPAHNHAKVQVKVGTKPVSYTHLDVYKRQSLVFLS